MALIFHPVRFSCHDFGMKGSFGFGFETNDALIQRCVAEIIPIGLDHLVRCSRSLGSLVMIFGAQIGFYNIKLADLFEPVKYVAIK